TVELLALAVTLPGVPKLEQALIAAARFEAKVVVRELVAKVAVLKLGHAFEPLPPAVGPLHEKPAAVPPSVKVMSDPGVVAVTVTTFELTVALTPTLLPFPPALIAPLTC